MTDEPPPKKGDTRVFHGELQEFDGSEWGTFQFLAPKGSGGDGKLKVIYKFLSDDEADA
jgi:hypothetical protein